MNRFTVLPPHCGKRPEVPAFDEALGSELVRSILDSSADCIKLIDLDGRLIYMNRNGMNALEVEDFQPFKSAPWSSLWPKDTQTMLESAVEDASLGERTEFEAFCPTVRGTPRWWNVNVSPIRNDDGEIVRILATSRDVTARIQSENNLHERDIQLQSYAEHLAAELKEKEALIARQKVLTAEIDHRVKNSFALIASILRMKIRGMADGDAREALSDTVNRIASLSRVHEQLHSDVEAQEVALAPYLVKLTNDLADTLADESTIKLTKTTDLTVSSDVAVAVGLVTSELVSNALKHKNPGLPTHVRISLTEDSVDETYVLQVSDTGAGLPKDFALASCNTLGMQICRNYGRTLDGSFAAKNAPNCGAVFQLSFPKAAVECEPRLKRKI